MKVLIVGGVAGGATAAARLRRLDEKAEIIIFEKSGYVSYANCGLPYYIGDKIKKKSKLTLQTPQSFFERFNIDVRIKNEVIKINKADKSITVKDLETGNVYDEKYDKLVLSPGAKAVVPNVPGVDSNRIFTLRNVEDTFKIKEYIEEHNTKSATIVGGGFIGLEMAENLMELGIKTTLIQRGKQVMPPVDYDMASQIHSYLRSKGLDLRLGQTIEKYQEDGDMVILAIGVTPDSHLAEDAGLELSIKKSIVVNERMETSEPDIYALGDAVAVTNFVTGKKALISLAGPANKQGRIVADNIHGIKSEFKGSQGSSIIKLFDMTVATTGINEKIAIAENIKYDKVINFSPSHATYYPGAKDMTIKTLFDPDTGRILGCQIVGFDGVDKRIDVMATAIRGKMTSADLAQLDLAYAPPYSSAKDPVNMVGFLIENIRNGLLKQYHYPEIDELPKYDDVVVLDTRGKDEYEEGAIAGSINIPLDELRENLDKLDKTKKLYVNCYSGLRSYVACRMLSNAGFECYNLSGGYGFYEYIKYDKEFDEIPKHICGIEIKD